jgi:predicted Zn finger-like uncharacterized protein
MFISCPSCSTSFSVDGVNIGNSGQSVRCFKCAHIWHQYPTVGQIQPQYIPVQYVPPGQFSIPPQMLSPALPQPQYAPVSAPASSAVASAGPIPEPVAAVQPIPEPIIVSEPTIAQEPIRENLPSDEELDTMLGSVSADQENALFAETGNEEVNEIELDDLEALDDPEPLVSVASDTMDDVEEVVDPENIPDPDPFGATTFDQGEIEEEKSKGGIVKTLVKALILLVVLSGIGGGAFYERNMLVNLVPETNIIFKLIGFGVAVPGDGLKLRSGDPTKEKRNGKDVTVIKGMVTNISDVDQRIPEILVKAIDAAEKVVQTQTLKPSKLILAPGKSEKFTGVFENLPRTAKRLDITYGAFVEGIETKAKTPKDQGAKPAAPVKETVPKPLVSKNDLAK